MQQIDGQPSAPAGLSWQKNKPKIGVGLVIAIVLVVAAASFIAGSRSEFLLQLFQGKNSSNMAQDLDLSSVQDVYDKLRQDFDGELDTNKLIDGVKKGLVDAAGDPYTAYFTKEEAEQFFSSLEGKFSGIGAELGKKDSNLVIVATLDDSPARKSGLLPSDIIAKVNDVETTGWSIEQAVTQIRGDKGTTVKLTIVRGQTVKEFSIQRDEIINPSVKSEITDQNIGIIRISRFAEDTAGLTRKAAQEFKTKGVKGVILDVRGNGGGYLKAAQEVASLWVKKGDVIVQEKTGKTVKETLKSLGDNILADMPTVVLIDGGSASASEIVAGALHDHKLAKLVGERSFGKGSVQDVIELTGGAQLKVTIAKWFTPSGKNITKEGIEPDEAVEITDAQFAAGQDPQKEKALQLLAQ